MNTMVFGCFFSRDFEHSTTNEHECAPVSPTIQRIDRQKKSKNENENAHTQLNEMKLPRIRKYSENKVNAHFSFVEIPVNSDDAFGIHA